MKQILFTEITLEELTTEITKSVIASLVPLINNVSSNNEQPNFITRNDIRELFGVSLVTVNDWDRKGFLKSYKIGTRIRYKKDEVLASIQSNAVKLRKNKTN